MDTEYLPPFEIKELSDDGVFTGIASIYGVEDLGGDVIDKGAFTKTVSENPTIPVLWQHKSDEVIGEGTVSEWQGKLMLKGKLDMSDATAKKAHGKMKAKLIKGLSIGFTTVKSTFAEVEGRLVRHISELKLWEVSVVTFPMLPSAQVTRVKSMEGQEAEIKLLKEQVQALQAQIASLREPTAVTPESDKGATLPEPTMVTPEEPAMPAEPPMQASTEPVEDHSAAESEVAAIFDDIRSLIPA